MTEGHGHQHMHSHDSHDAMGAHRQDSQRRLVLALWFTGSIFVAELVGGLVTGSLALLSDAAHMFLDVLGLVMSYAAIRIAWLPADRQYSFGFHRVQVLAALANAVTLVLVALGIFREAWERFSAPPQIMATPMLVIALIGLASNVASALVLHGHDHEDINVHGAFLHVLGDALGSIGVLVAAVIIMITGRTEVDAIVSVIIGLIVAYSSIGLLRQSVRILAEGVPEGISLDEIAAAMRTVPGVTDVHDLHVWSLGPGFSALSAHVVVDTGTLAEVQEVMPRLGQLLHDDFHIEHRTIQVEWTNCGQGERTCYAPVGHGK